MEFFSCHFIDSPLIDTSFLGINLIPLQLCNMLVDEIQPRTSLTSHHAIPRIYLGYLRTTCAA